MTTTTDRNATVRAMSRAGILTGTMPTTTEQDAVFGPMHEAAMYSPRVYTFARDLSDTITVSLGYAAYDRGVHYVAYRVEFSATGEIYSGMDFCRDMHTEVRTERAAVALLAELGAVTTDAALTAFAASLSA